MSSRVRGIILIAVAACGGSHPSEPARALTVPAAVPLADAGVTGEAVGGAAATIDAGSQPIAIGPRFDMTGIDPQACPLVALPAPERIVVTSALIETSSVIPPECGPEVQRAIVATRFVDGADGRRYGHVRVRRRDVEDKPTLPSVLAASSDRGVECEALATFRIEDHVIDLASARHVGGVAQTYRVPLYQDVGVPVISIDRLSITKQGIIVDPRRCTPFSLRR